MDVKKKEVFYKNLTYIYLEMPKFRKTEEQLETLSDKWLYALKNLPRLLERPKALQERIFAKFFKVAERANLSKEDYAKYFESEKVYYDLDGAFRTASMKGLAKGRAEGRAEGLAEGMKNANRENARKMKARGYDIEDIADITGLTAEQINSL